MVKEVGYAGHMMKVALPVTLVFAVLLSTLAAWAAPREYRLDPSGSSVAFTWQFGPDTFRGRMGIARADLTIDFDNVANSRVSVAVDASQADAGFPFATDAMRGPRVLDTGTHPMITFQSRSVSRTGPGTARILGDFTVRGVTRPGELTAQIFRAAGSDPGDLTNLTIRLTGSLNRSDFGATGWSDLVGDPVGLDITAMISEAG